MSVKNHANQLNGLMTLLAYRIMTILFSMSWGGSGSGKSIKEIWYSLLKQTNNSSLELSTHRLLTYYLHHCDLLWFVRRQDTVDH